jgi:class 3 adenylate cyclase
MEVSQPRYAKTADGVQIAYATDGLGPVDLVQVPSFSSHLEVWFEHPLSALWHERLSSFARVIDFDKRGTGLSDRPGGAPSLEERMDDVRAVMDAVSTGRAALVGYWDGGPMSALFAATYPERVSALILWGTMATFTRQVDYPWAPAPEANQAMIAAIEQGWGTGISAALVAPGQFDDPSFRSWWARLERNSVSPSGAAAIFRLNTTIDVRPILPTIRVPTLVLHRRGDRVVPVESGRYVASQIPGARFVELPGDSHLNFVGNADTVADEIEEFLTGVRPARQPERVLATVVFTDIVSSTERAASLGDRRWRELLDQLDHDTGRAVAWGRGRLVKSTGDGHLAIFDGPARAIRSGCALRAALRDRGIDLRVGVHTGEVELRGDDVAGVGVHLAQRVCALARPGEVLVSRTVVDLVAGSDIDFEDRGVHKLKGLPGAWHLFAATA